MKTRFRMSLAVIFAATVSFSVFAHNNVVVVPLGEDAPVPPTPAPKTVFVSSEQPNADLGGVDGADAICAADASSSTHPNVIDKDFKAWLYDQDTRTIPGPPEGTRDFILPAGIINSPTGRSFPTGLAASLISGRFNYSEFESCQISGCTEQLYSDTFPLEDSLGQALVPLVSPLQPQAEVRVIFPTLSTFSDRQFLDGGCRDYTNQGNVSPENETLAVIRFRRSEQELLGYDIEARISHPTSLGAACSVPVNFFCVEQ